MKKLYLECFSGISGDMTAAALLDLGVSEEALLSALKSLPLHGYEIRISTVEKSGIKAKDFDVILEHDNHDHDMEYLYGHETEHEEAHPHGHHHHGDAPHVHRTLKDIREIIDKSTLTEGAKKKALQIFDVIAEAEGAVHGSDKEAVHFHEVGAVDSIVDVAAIAFCLDALGYEEVIVPLVYEGFGTVRCQHGVIPVPVPAVTEIAKRYSIGFHPMGLPGEFVTPTGAAVIAAVRTDTALPERYRIVSIGVGAGKRSYDGPGVLRAMVIEET